MALNRNCPGVKRLMREAAELAEPTEHYHAAPLEDNLFEWHFTVRGAHGTPFEGGLYHGRILFPPNYPLKPPSVILLTPNGRFELNRKICLSISDFHPETWQPSWSIRTVLLALVGFMPTPGNGAIGALDWTEAERKKLAAASRAWRCGVCGSANAEALLPLAEGGEEGVPAEAARYAAELRFAAEKAQPAGQAAEEASQPGEGVEAAAEESAPVSAAAPEQPAPAPAPPVQRMAEPVREQSNGGYCSLFLLYLLVGLISALFLRRALRTIRSELWTDNPFD